MIFIERYPKLIASKVNCFLNIHDLSEVQLCMSSNSYTWECPHTKDGADHVSLIFLSSVIYNKLLGVIFVTSIGFITMRHTVHVHLNWFIKFTLYQCTTQFILKDELFWP